MIASRDGHTDVVKCLIEAKASPDLQREVNCDSKLIFLFLLHLLLFFSLIISLCLTTEFMDCLNAGIRTWSYRCREVSHWSKSVTGSSKGGKLWLKTYLTLKCIRGYTWTQYFVFRVFCLNAWRSVSLFFVIAYNFSYASFGEKKWYGLRHFHAYYRKLSLLRNVTKLVLSVIFKQNTFFKFYFKNVNVDIFSYFESNFIDKLIWGNVSFFNCGHVTIFPKTKIRFLAFILKENILRFFLLIYVYAS